MRAALKKAIEDAEFAEKQVFLKAIRRANRKRNHRRPKRLLSLGRNVKGTTDRSARVKAP